MGQLSDDESSDSSNEFLVPADKIDLNSTFFKQSAKKPNPKKTRVIRDSSDDSDDEFDYANDNDVSSSELLAQVLKNLENAKNQSLVAATSQSEPSTSKAAGQSSDSKGDDLSKEINDLLLQGESASTLSKQDNDDENEVKDSKVEAKSSYSIPQTGVQIHLPGQNIMFDRKKKKQQDLQRVLKNKINQRIRTTQLFVHKVGLLTWISHGFFLNKLANEPELLAIALSLVSQNNYPKDRPDLKYLERFTKWFTGLFKICEKHKEVVYNKELLLQRLADRKIYNYVELVLLYIATLRGMGINCRLVVSLRPPALKPRPEQLFRIPTNEESGASSIKVEEKTSKQKNNATKTTAATGKTSKGKPGRGKTKSKKQSVSPSKVVPENSQEAAKTAKEEAKKKAAAILKGKSINKKSGTKENKSDRTADFEKGKSDNSDDEDDKDVEDESNTTIARKLRLRTQKSTETKKNKTNTSKNKKQAKSKSKDDESYSEEEEEEEEDEDSLSEAFSEEESDFSSDNEYEEKKPKQRVKKTNQNNSIASKLAKQTNKQRKLLSSDEEDSSLVKNVFNIWVEVYLESEESWISVDVLEQKIHCVSEIYKKAGNPVLYVVAWNSAGTLKDVTRRYCPNWLTVTRKKRVDEKWWSGTLSEWKEKKTAMSRAEDEQLLQRELEQPLPKTVGECKGHPLYALTRHLLKFEALYPPDAVPLGHLKTGEAIYSRHCVHTLYSRETWVKKARVVKPAQEAYKIVKSMPKYDKLSGTKIKDQPLELFGKWQTGPYIPPEAKDGKVPRNEYGNVDLFRMCMLPKGTSYINLPALNRVARKLNIDCAPACVGFNFGCRGALPAFEGFVVCSEYEDTIREAWEEDQIESQKRAKEKREKRIYGNWKKLIKGLLIRRKLAAKYNFGGKEEYTDDDEEEVQPTRKKTVAAKKKPAKQFSIKRKPLEDTDNEEEEEALALKKKVFKKLKIPVAKSATEISDQKVKEECTEESKGTEETVSPDKKTVIAKKTRTTAAKAAKVSQKEEEEEHTDDEEIKEATSIDNKSKIAQKLKAFTFKSASKAPEKDVKEESSEDEEIEEATTTKKKAVITKKTTVPATRATRATRASLKREKEESTDDEETEEAAPPKKKAAASKKVTVTTTRVATRASKRTKQEPGNAKKKTKR